MKKMRHFLVFALIVAMFTGAVDANAKTKRKKTSRTKTTKTTKTKKNKDVVDDFINLEFFQNIVEEANKTTPIDEEGITITSIKMEGKTIYYDADVYDAEIIETMKEMPSTFEGFMKSYMAKYMYEVFCTEEYGDLVVDQMAKLGISICYRFHEKGKSAILSNFTITGKEMKAAARGY